MKLDDLANSLEQTAADGQIGTPVALRIYLRHADRDADGKEPAVAAILMGNRLFQSDPQRIVAQAADPGQTSVLVSYTSGATLFVTVECGLTAESTVQLLFIGNHGVANLEPAGWDPSRLEFDEREAAPLREQLLG